MNFLVVLHVLFSIVGLVLPHNICLLPPAETDEDGEDCIVYNPCYTYYPAENACKQFIYRGCGGNMNRFHSLAYCEFICKRHGILGIVTLPPKKT